jgi:hypothetical protein
MLLPVADVLPPLSAAKRYDEPDFRFPDLNEAARAADAYA